MADLVSFPLRMVIELVPAEEGEAAAKERAERRAWLAERGYRVVSVRPPTSSAMPPPCSTISTPGSWRSMR